MLLFAYKSSDPLIPSVLGISAVMLQPEKHKCNHLLFPVRQALNHLAYRSPSLWATPGAMRPAKVITAGAMQ